MDGKSRVKHVKGVFHMKAIPRGAEWLQSDKSYIHVIITLGKVFRE